MDVLNVKSDPLLIGSLRGQDGYFPAYHMNKEKWLSIQLGKATCPSGLSVPCRNLSRRDIHE